MRDIDWPFPETPAEPSDSYYKKRDKRRLSWETRTGDFPNNFGSSIRFPSYKKDNKRRL